jgi:proline dehydrogenase
MPRPIFPCRAPPVAEDVTLASSASTRAWQGVFDRPMRRASSVIGMRPSPDQDRENLPVGLMEVFLAEYGLSTDEGVALMCLAEALLRVPDAETIDDADRGQDRAVGLGRHLGQSSSPLVNASTWALMLTGKVLDDDPSKPASPARCAAGQAAGRAGDPHRRRAGDARDGPPVRARPDHRERDGAARRWRRKGYTYSYDMLGEAARPRRCAALRQLRRAIAAIAGRGTAISATTPASRSSSRRCIRATRSPARPVMGS